MSEYRMKVEKVQGLYSGVTFPVSYVVGEIVRCSDCRHFVSKGTHRFDGGKVNDDFCEYIRSWMLQVSPDGFCAWGERKAVKE